MRGAIAPRRLPVELSGDPSFARRVRRLGATSVVALGVIWALAAITTAAPLPILAALLAGWVLMPAMLFASLERPALRWALPLPASLVTVGVLALLTVTPPDGATATVGWVLILVGVALGGAMGLWLWYRLLPVPAGLDHPFSAARWGLIRIHVALIVAGIGLAATELI